jgi:SAM-dependent methyltransferase
MQVLCRSCGYSQLDLILDLGMHGWCNDFLTKDQIGKEKTYPLRLVRCPMCTLCQLDYTVPKETMFTEHDYVSGTTKSLAAHFAEIARAHEKYLTKDSVILDIGGNDGTNLLEYRKLGYQNLINVESAGNIAIMSAEAGIYTYNMFFNEEFVDEHGLENKVDLINASGVFFHLEELHSVIKGIKKSLKPNGVLVVQFMYLGSMIEKGSFDGIYHEHLCFYSMTSLDSLLSLHDLMIEDAEYYDIHGGSVVATIKHGKPPFPISSEFKPCDQESLRNFKKNVEAWRERFKHLIQTCKQTGPIYGLGAPAKGNTLLTYCGFTTDDIEALLEVNPLKVGKYTPVTHIPIIEEDFDYIDTDSAWFLILSWNFAEEIKANVRKKLPNAKFILPFGEICR